MAGTMCEITGLKGYIAQDLALYKKFRDKEVASAARGLISLFREVAPGMLEKRDRGRDADLQATPLAYGARLPASRVEGAELLQSALERGDSDASGSEDDSAASEASDHEDGAGELEGEVSGEDAAADSDGPAM